MTFPGKKGISFFFKICFDKAGAHSVLWQAVSAVASTLLSSSPALIT